MRTESPSNSEKGISYEVVVYYGGEVECSCYHGMYLKKGERCSHGEKVWASLTPFQRRLVMKHDEVAARWR